jgi:exportin-5
VLTLAVFLEQIILLVSLCPHCQRLSYDRGEQQVQVLEWLFGPMQQQWILPSWQEKYLASPASLVRLLTQDVSIANAHEEMWSMYHTVTFFERALRRCTNPSGKAPSGPSSTADNVDMDAAAMPASNHAMIPHLAWMFSPLLKVRRKVNPV